MHDDNHCDFILPAPQAFPLLKALHDMTIAEGKGT